MQIVTLSDLHIGKWNNFGMSMLDKARDIGGNILWLNGDIIEPEAGVNEEFVLNQIKHLTSDFDLIVWVAGNNCLELKSLTGPISSYNEELFNVLDSYDIHLLDFSSITFGDYELIGSIGWHNGDLWVQCKHESSNPNTVSACLKRQNEFYKEKFEERWDLSSLDFFRMVQKNLYDDISDSLRREKKIILGTHFVTSKEFCLYGSNPRYDYLNWYMGFNGEGLYNFAKPELSFVGHTHRTKKVRVGEFDVVNISGGSNPFSFTLC